MLVYVFILILILLNCFIESKISAVKIYNKNIKVKSLSFGLSYSYILLLGLLRNEELGVDVANYKFYFNNLYNSMSLKDIINSSNVDTGYAILNKITYLFTYNFRVLEVIIFVFSFTIFSIVILKRSQYPALSFLIYIGMGFLGINLCLLRQAIAYSLCFASFDYLKRNKYIQYFLLLLLAFLFHKTAIFFIITFYIKCRSVIKSNLIRETTIIIISLLSSFYILPQVYKYYAIDYSSINIIGEGYKLMILYILISLSLYYIMKKSKFKNDIYDYKCSKLSVYCQIIALRFSLFTRVTNYFSLLFTLSIPNIIYSSKNKRVYYFVAISIFTALYLYNIFIDNFNIVPYISIFN